jgi:AcrR family transcriptional regulator
MTKRSTNRTKAAPGRPRDRETTASILRAALDLAEERGFDSLSVEGVAARAGVAKTTIYRRWPNAWAIVMDAFLAEVTRLAPIQARATARDSLAASMRLLARAYRGRPGKLLRPLLGRAQVEQDLREEVRTRWVEPRRQAAREVIRRGIEAGELRADLDADVMLDALYGPLYHRLLVPYEEALDQQHVNDSPLSDAYIDALVDTVFGGVARQPGRRPSDGPA